MLTLNLKRENSENASLSYLSFSIYYNSFDVSFLLNPNNHSNYLIIGLSVGLKLLFWLFWISKILESKPWYYRKINFFIQLLLKKQNIRYIDAKSYIFLNACNMFFFILLHMNSPQCVFIKACSKCFGRSLLSKVVVFRQV